MSPRDVLLPLSLLALAGAIAFSALPRAAAQDLGPDVDRPGAETRTVCRTTAGTSGATERWIDARLAEGRTRFAHTGRYFCAW